MPARAGVAPRCLIPLSLLLVSLVVPTAAVAAPSTTNLLVKFRAGITTSVASNAVSRFGGNDLRTIPHIGVHVVSVPSNEAAHSLSALKADARVQFAERDGTAKPQESVPNNPYFPDGNYSLNGGAWGWWQTHTTQAWDITQGSPSVVIAILDTGLKPQGLNFGNQIVQGYDLLNGTTDTTTNAGNHGTYVAAAAVQAPNTGIGNAGYCASCDVMPVQVGTDSGASYSDMATGITWAADHGARIENLSWAGTSASSTLASAVSYANSKGVIVFAAAGNSNCNCATYPAATPGVLGVAGVANDGTKAGDSNYGSWVAVAAPEGNMTGWPTLNGAPGFAQVGGTSLASPAAAGIAGLILSADPNLSLIQLEQTIESSATPVPFQVVYGEVDAMAALHSLGYSDPQQATMPLNTVAPQLLLETNGEDNAAPMTIAPQVGQVLARGPGAWTGSSPLSLAGIEWDRCTTSGSSCVAVGSMSTYTVQSADTGYVLRVKITFSDPNGSTTATSALSAPVGGSSTVSPPSNSAPPTIAGTPQSGKTLTASTGTWSNSPTSYAYQWSRCDSSGANCVGVSGATGSSYALTSLDVGYAIEVAVSGSNSGGSTSAGSAPTAVVQAGTQTQTLSGSSGAKGGSQSFNVTVGAGTANASLSFRCTSMKLSLTSGATTLASTSGPSVLALTGTLAAGTYSYQVGSSGRCSYTLTVRFAAA
jgi:subtilisin family serine protease